jgi:hypothetical protein
MATQVPNTTTFALTDVTAVVGGTSLTAAYTNSTDAFFDPTYKGSKNSQYNFRNYTVQLAGGYGFGGYTAASLINRIYKLSFSAGTYSTLGATLATAKDVIFAGTSSPTNHYVSGGRTNLSGNAITNAVEKFVFSTDTMTSFSNTLSTTRWYHVGYSDGTTYGYWSTGINQSASTPYTGVTDMITFSTEAIAANGSATCSPARRYAGVTSSLGNAGWVGGGSSNAYVTSVDKITYSTQTRSANVNNLSVAGGFRQGLNSGSTYGYYCGGITGSTLTTYTDRITYSTSAIGAFGTSNLVTAKRMGFTVSDGTTYGYYTGGYSTAGVATSERMTFSTQVFASYGTASLATGTWQQGSGSPNCLSA